MIPRNKATSYNHTAMHFTDEGFANEFLKCGCFNSRGWGIAPLEIPCEARERTGRGLFALGEER